MANGYKVVGEADNGLKAVRLFAEKHPTLVTMDLDMPVMDGYEATRQIKRIDPDAKVIVISQVMNRSMILDALDAGAIDFLTKPVPIDRLLQLMSRVIASMGHGKTRMANR
jgi:two-component system chemotaxis response regulator CheY